MTAEQREMFQEICDDVQHLQDEIAKFQGMKLANGAPCQIRACACRAL